ncbi:WD repeat protein [Gregarina niphandrodes]|uniref:WD repeat protein n=1 Tax=Gregarina niphandrodes TaxID=110365 RepID=A0A023B0B7_GRENI|nr:WD repeat protein [Gregarina niphandrodes]EZG45100.1 WD repeat protein [Gregarina niphandrodes]|eukprot:XP_011132563.1 WD repeat protein [Gregarina niphandrodes]
MLSRRSADEFTGFDDLDEESVAESRGFEVVWLADQDDISTAVKEWVSERDGSGQGGCVQGTQTGAKPAAPLAVWTVAVTSDHQYLACGSNGGLIFVWQLNEGPQLEEELEQDVAAEKSPVEKRSMLRRVATLSGHTGGVLRLQWNTSVTHRVLLSSGFDSTVRLWSVFPAPATLCILKCPALPVGVCFAGGGDAAAVVTCLDGATRLISFTPPPAQAVPGPAADAPPLVNCKVDRAFAGKDAATHMSVSPCGSVLAVGSQFGVVTLSDLGTGQVIREVHCRNHFGRHKTGEKITGISWNSNSRYIAVTSRDGRIRIIDIQDPSRRVKLKAQSDPRLVAIFDPSDRFVLAAAENGHIYVWDLMKACREKVHRRRRFYLARSFSKSALSEGDAVPENGLEIAPLNEEFKRETAHPVASFAAHKGVPTAMCMMPFENSTIPPLLFVEPLESYWAPSADLSKCMSSYYRNDVLMCDVLHE